MKILSVECSAKSASCAIVEDGKIISSFFTNAKITHSQTLMPMIKEMLESSETDIKDIGLFAVSSGPGSFTGIRIGISLIKGMALCRNTPCIGVSSLLALAYNFTLSDCNVVGVFDARCNQVYTASFAIRKGKVKRLTEDRAVKIEELKNEVLKSKSKCPIVLAGDGAKLFYPFVKDKKNIILASEQLLLPNGVGVAFACQKEKEFVTAQNLLPVYLRLPQAQRELNAKKEKEK